MDEGLFAALETYAWPGNVRALRNALERMAILTPGETLTLESVPLEIRMPAAAPSSLRAARDAAERDQIQRTLEAAAGNVSAAARALGLERTALHKRLRALGLGRG